VRVTVCNAYAKRLGVHKQQPVVLCLARDSLPKKRPMTANARAGLLAATTRGTDRQPGMFPFVLDMEVMLRVNIGVPLGLCNGSRGYIRDIIFDDGVQGRLVPSAADPNVFFMEKQPKCIIVEFPNATLPRPLTGLPPNHVPIVPVKQSFKYGPKQNVVYRSQFPLVPCKAVTGYNVQGQTLEAGAVVDLHPAPRSSAADVYVSLSRVTSWKKLALLRPVTKEQLNNKPSEDLLQFDKFCDFFAREVALEFLEDHPDFADSYDKSWFPEGDYVPTTAAANAAASFQRQKDPKKRRRRQKRRDAAIEQGNEVGDGDVEMSGESQVRLTCLCKLND
jgi:hypothetical protein